MEGLFVVPLKLRYISMVPGRRVSFRLLKELVHEEARRRRGMCGTVRVFDTQIIDLVLCFVFAWWP